MEGPDMFGKRIDRPGGSRRAVRHDIMLPTAMMTMTDTLNVDLLDLSKSGAKLRGSENPALGQEVLLLVGGLEAFASVIWRDADECGIHFDRPLSETVLAIVEEERRQVSRLGPGPDAMLVAGDWMNGLAR